MKSQDEQQPVLPSVAHASYTAGPLFDNLRLLTIEQVANLLGKRPQTIRNWVALRKIPFIPGRPVMFREKAVAAWLAQREKQPWQ